MPVGIDGFLPKSQKWILENGGKVESSPCRKKKGSEGDDINHNNAI